MYSLVALLMAIPIFLFLAFSMSAANAPSSAAMDRVVADQAHQVEKSMEEDFARAVNIAGRRALLALLMNITDSGAYFHDAGPAVEELITNGTLQGNESAIMAGNTLAEWQAKLLAVQTGFKKSLSFYVLSADGSGGFDMLVSARLEANVTDSTGKFRIDRQFISDFPVSITNIEDPVYTVETDGMVTRSVRPYTHPLYAVKALSGTAHGVCSGNATFDAGSPNADRILITADGTGASGFAGVVAETGVPSTECYMTGAANAISLLNGTVQEAGSGWLLIDNATSGVWSLPFRDGLDNGGYYNGYGAGFHGRLEGNLTPHNGGIVSFVNTEDLAAAGITIKENQTRTDYLYFPDAIISGRTVRGMPAWFRIDAATAARFNLTDLLNP